MQRDLLAGNTKIENIMAGTRGIECYRFLFGATLTCQQWLRQLIRGLFRG